MKIIVSFSPRINPLLYLSPKIKELLKSIKENKQLLLEYLPFSRKVILILFTLNYSLGSKVLNILSKISGKTI